MEWTEALRKSDTDKKTILCTILDGENKASRVIISGDACIYKDDTIDTELLNRIELEAGNIKKTTSLRITGRGMRDSETSVTVFFEILKDLPKLVICGGGHVAAALTTAAKLIGMEVTVIDDRLTFAENGRRAGADHVICDGFSSALSHVEGDLSTYFVIMTRGHRYDKDCLRAIAKKKFAYLGMMASKHRSAALKKEMAKEGMSDELLSSIHMPIGLSINSDSPAEIAVSILAEIIMEKNSEKPSEGYAEELLRALDDTKDKVFCMIIGRRGSTPRSIGTKMVVYRDRSTRGTIGGGCAEAEVITAAYRLLQSDDKNADRKSDLIRIEMTEQDAEEEGMVCGGIQDIYMEVF